MSSGRPDPVGGRRVRSAACCLLPAARCLLSGVRCLLPAACCLLLAAPDAALPAPVRAVTLRTADGVTLAASYFEPSRRPAPAVIFVHMLTRTHDDWRTLASQLADAGVAGLAIDLRGHGASGRAAPRPDTDVKDGKEVKTVKPGEPVEPVGPIDLTDMVRDLRAARAFLSARPEVGASKIGIAGASIGANLAVLAAAEDAAVRSIALLSPGLDYRGLRIEGALRKYGERPALLVASRDDPYAARSVRQLATTGGPREVRWLEGVGHGTVMLTRDGDLVRVLVDWFLRTLI